MLPGNVSDKITTTHSASGSAEHLSDMISAAISLFFLCFFKHRRPAIVESSL